MNTTKLKHYKWLKWLLATPCERIDLCYPCHKPYVNEWKIQYEKDNFLDYIRRFKQTCDVVKSQAGTEFLDTFVTNEE